MFRASDAELSKALEKCDDQRLRQIEQKFGIDLARFNPKKPPKPNRDKSQPQTAAKNSKPDKTGLKSRPQKENTEMSPRSKLVLRKKFMYDED